MLQVELLLVQIHLPNLNTNQSYPDVVCGAGRTKKTVTLKAGESANFFTSAPGTDYKKNVKCQAVFKVS